MNNILQIKDDSDLDNTLDALWASDNYQPRDWLVWILSLDENIIEADYNSITFIDEQSKMFFILKYS